MTQPEQLELELAPAQPRGTQRPKSAAGKSKSEPANVVPFPLAAHVNALRVAAALRGIRNEAARLRVFREHLQHARELRLRAGLLPEIVKADVTAYAEVIRRAFWSPGGIPTDHPRARPVA